MLQSALHYAIVGLLRRPGAALMVSSRENASSAAPLKLDRQKGQACRESTHVSLLDHANIIAPYSTSSAAPLELYRQHFPEACWQRTYVSLLDHAHIVGAIPDAQRGVASGLHQGGDLSLLLWRDATAHDCCALSPHLYTSISLRWL